MTKLCKHCGLTLHLREREGDICLTCLQSLTPHCSFDGGYYSPDAVIKMGVIRQTIAQNENLTDRKKTDNERRKPIQHTNRAIKQRDRKD